MGDLIRPKIKIPEPSAEQKAAEQAASNERLNAIRDQARARTEQLLRLFGSRGALGFGRGRGF